MTAGVLPIESKNESELLEREGRIERAQRNAYYEIGLELKAIRKAELYKTPRQQQVNGRYSFTTFEEYVEGRWDMDDSRARKLIGAADAASKIGKIFPVLPSRESHVRELMELESDDDRAAVWQDVVNREETITAKVVNEEVQRFIAAKEKNWITLDEWKELDAPDDLFGKASKRQFNKQDNASIEWARWSWNPITGCKHDCPYCYARDIANRFYPQKFEPSIYPDRFSAPKNTKAPSPDNRDISYRNVFACSMADLFGRWVPAEWIQRVLDTVEQNPQWNFLFLTKFPKRMAEFNIPNNAWMGTTVDCQARVRAAEAAFAEVGSGVKWLSIEPMLEPLEFTNLEVFDWIVIGGASPSAKTPKWVPPIDWIAKIHQKAREAGCAIYYKDNCGMDDGMRIQEFPWGEAPEIPSFAPDVFKYLGR